MVEFIIIFRFNNKDHKARVVKTDNGEAIEYDVRPVSPFIVKKFGKQIRIFRKEDQYTSNTQGDEEHRELFNCLIEAIRVGDIEFRN